MKSWLIFRITSQDDEFIDELVFDISDLKDYKVAGKTTYKIFKKLRKQYPTAKIQTATTNTIWPR